MNVVQPLFAIQPGRHRPVEALAGLDPFMAKSGRFPFLCLLLSPGDGPMRFIAWGDNDMPDSGFQ